MRRKRKTKFIIFNFDTGAPTVLFTGSSQVLAHLGT